MDRVSSYLAMDRRHALATNRSLPDRAEGTALFADIVGFTHLTDTLVATLGPRRGAEEMIRLLNGVYEALITLVHRYGGSAISFSGDGFTCWFDRDAGLQATACGLALQQALQPFASVPVPGGEPVSVALKVALAAGPARRLVVGAPQVQRLDLLAGATLERLALAEQQAAQGEVLVGPEVAQNLGQRLDLANWRAGFGLVAGLSVEVPPAPWPELDAATLSAEAVRPFLLRPVYERLMAGQGEFLAELRPAVALFLRFGGLDYDAPAARPDDDAAARLDAYVRWVQGVLERYGGHLLQLTSGEKGDYLYASFGALTVHEDDAERAVAAALALLRLPPELDFINQVQIGLSQGRVRAGAYGSQARRTYGAQGDEVIVAARLMQAAPPGEVRCSRRIYRAARSDWAFDALPPVQLKGKAEPLPIYRPRQRSEAGRTRPASALVGRRAEMATLATLLDEASSGQRRVLLLLGEAGIGKSRLLAELAGLARARDTVWLEGAGQSIEQGTPYRAWRELLAGHFGLEAQLEPPEPQRRVRERVAAIDPALVERAPLLNDVLHLDLPETDLTRGFDPKLRHDSLTALVVDLLRDAVRRQPLALVLEDAHWLDSLSWELALAAGRALYDRPLLLVLAFRPLEEPLPAAYRALAALEGAERVHLEAMPPDETVALAAARLGLPPEALPPQVANLVRERAGGNPFFAEELAHALHDSGALAVAEGACTLLADPAALREKVPDTVEGVVLSRIDRLPAEELLTLKVAAVAGRSFLYRTVRDVHPRQVIEDLLRTHLDDLARRDLTPLEALEPELTYLFKHIITQQVAYDTLLFAQRRALHREVAGWYERAYAGNLSPYYPLLVHHWHGAEDGARERHYAQLAGEQAAAQYANAEAVAFLSRALALTPEDDLAGRYALLLAREKARNLQGDREAQRQDLRALDELANTLDDDRLRAEVALRRAGYALSTGDLPAATSAAQEVIHHAQAAQDAHLEAAGYQRRGSVQWLQGDARGALPWAETALAMAKRHGLRADEASILCELGTIRGRLSDYDQAREYYKQALPILRETKNMQAETTILNNSGNISRLEGDYAQAQVYFEQNLRLQRELGHRLRESGALNNLGLVYRDQGYYLQARSCFEQSLRIKREVGDYAGEAHSFYGMGLLTLALGDCASAQENLEQALHISRKTGIRLVEAGVLAGLSLLFRLQGDDQAALEHAQQALALFQELNARHGVGDTLIELGHTLTGLDRLTEAADSFHQAITLLGEIGEHHLVMAARAGLIRVFLVEGDLSGAQVQVEEILAYLESNTLTGTGEPFRIYLACYQALQANQDPRAQEILNSAQALLQEQAAKIEDEALRRSYLENVVVNHQIVAAYQALQEAP